MTQCMLVSFSGVCLFRNSYEIDAGCMCLKWRWNTTIESDYSDFLKLFSTIEPISKTNNMFMLGFLEYVIVI